MNRASAKAMEWLNQKINKYQESKSNTTFYLTFGGITRYFDKTPLQATDEELTQADELRTGFDPSHWTVSLTARAYLVLHLPIDEEQAFLEPLEALFSTADMGEQVALYSSLPILPFPEALVHRTTEGIRTNIQDVFDAIALNNPYPADYLPESAWNQMVLKAAFMDRPIHRIVGLERRANAPLAKIIADYAHERWAAGRSVSPEFWRVFGEHLQPEMLADVEKLLEDDHILQRQAGMLVCQNSQLASAGMLYEQFREKIDMEGASWESIGEAWWRQKVE